MRLPLDAKPYLNIDDPVQQGINRFLDAAKDDLSCNIRRPGLGGASGYFVDIGSSPVDSIIEWESQGWAAAVAGGKIYKVTSAGGVTEITGATLGIGTPVYAVDWGSSLYLANGGRIIKWAATDITCAYISDADAPVGVSHVAFYDQYLMGLQSNSEQFWWSDVNAPDTWTGQYASAETRRDKVVALHTGWDEITLFGAATIESWYNRGDAPFVKKVGVTVERGCIAPHSIQMIDNAYFFLDHERKVVRLSGRQPTIISNPFDNEIQALTTISDCRGLHVHCDASTFYVLTFPTEGKTYAYDYKRDIWSEWTYYNTMLGGRERWLGNCSCYMRAWNKHLVGSRLDGKIYYASRNYYQDGSAPMVFELWTGQLGTGQYRSVAELLICLRRGTMVAPAIDPFLLLYYRDNGSTQWIGPRHIHLDKAGGTEIITVLHQLGRCRTRQYRFVCSENMPVCLVGGKETVV